MSDQDGVRVQRAEDAALPDGGRRFTTLVEVQDYVAGILTDPWWGERFPWAPLDVEVQARSSSATFSAAHVAASGEAVVLLRRGSWDAVTVIHELAHVAARSGLGDRAAHDEEFVSALTELWRRHLGVTAWAALVAELGERSPSTGRSGGTPGG